MELGLCEVYRNEKGKLKIDWSKTVAVAQRSAHVYINLKGRDPEGIVEPEDYEKTVQDVISKLYSYRDPKNWRPRYFILLDQRGNGSYRDGRSSLR